MFSKRHQLNESPFQWIDACNNKVNRTTEKLCFRASTTFIARDSTGYRENAFLHFKIEACADVLILAEQG